MTNPNNAVGTNGAYGGRTSVEALNDVLNTFTGGGIIRGWECLPSSGMTVALGGTTGYRDVAIAVAPSGARTTINNRTTGAINITIAAAPATNSRIDSIVAYVQNPAQGSETVVDNPTACGLIAVSGDVSSSPVAPTESRIRTAITADGGTGSTAYYVVLANITVVAGLTTITSTYIAQGAKATLSGDNIANSAITSGKINFSSFGNSSTGATGGWTPLSTSGVVICSKTITIAGTYFIIANGYFEASAAGVEMSIQKNGASIGTGYYSYTGYASITSSTFATLEVGDVVRTTGAGNGRVFKNETRSNMILIRIG